MSLVENFAEDNQESAKGLFISGLIGPIPFIFYYGYKLFKEDIEQYFTKK